MLLKLTLGWNEYKIMYKNNTSRKSWDVGIESILTISTIDIVDILNEYNVKSIQLWKLRMDALHYNGHLNNGIESIYLISTTSTTY